VAAQAPGDAVGVDDGVVDDRTQGHDQAGQDDGVEGGLAQPQHGEGGRQ
jgi:hypothetical protein